MYADDVFGNKPNDKMLALFQKLASLTTQQIISEASGPFAMKHSFDELESEYAKAAYEILELCLTQAKEYFATKIREKEKACASIDQNALLRQLYDFIKKHNCSGFNPMPNQPVNGQLKQKQGQNCIGYYRDTSNGREYLFTSDGLRKAVAGFDFRRARHELANKKVLVTGSSHDSRTVRIGNSKLRFYVVSFNALSHALKRIEDKASETFEKETKKRTDWLWYGWLPRGAFVVLAGAPGAGKTTLAVSIAAAVSTGSFPIGELGRPHDVLFFTREDSYQADILPKLAAASADLDRVRALEGLPDAGCGVAPFDPANDAGRLKELLLGLPTDKRPALVIIDGIADAVKRDSHNNTDVRHALMPYVELAREINACVIGTVAFAKDFKGRAILNKKISLNGFTARANIVLLVEKTSKDWNSPKRTLRQIKNNLTDLQAAKKLQIEESTIFIKNKAVKTATIKWES